MTRVKRSTREYSRMLFEFVCVGRFRLFGSRGIRYLYYCTFICTIIRDTGIGELRVTRFVRVVSFRGKEKHEKDE